VRQLTLIALLAALGLMVACSPRRTPRGGGGGDDDDATGDDDDTTGDDDDDAASSEAGLAWVETPYGVQELSATIAVSRIEGMGTTASLVAGEEVTCEGTAFFSMLVAEAWYALESGAIDLDDYMEMVSGAMLDLFGPSSWILSASGDMGDEEAPVVFEEGPLPGLVTFALGRLPDDVDDMDGDMLDEGVTSDSGDSWADGEVESFAGDQLTGWLAVEGIWVGGSTDGEWVHLHSDVEDAPVCE